MHRLLLVSTSTTHGTDYLEHCAEAAQELFAGCATIGFVPYAVYDRAAYSRKVGEAFSAWGFELRSVHEAERPADVVAAVDGLFVGGGNTFRLVGELHRQALVEPIRRRVAGGMPYMGTSAGSNVACPTLCTTNDMPIVEPPTFEALDLVPFQINPHYLDVDPGSTHMGETREQRLAEYLEESDRDILALREGSMLEITGSAMRILGKPGGRHLSRSGTRELADGDRLDALLDRKRPPDTAGC